MDNYISSTLTSGAPSASHWLAKIVTIELNKYAFSKKLASVHYIDLPIATRKHIFKDYSILNYNKREKAQELQTALVSTPKLSSKDKMIIINDTYVTGSQYRKQNEMLTHAGLKEKQMLWFYISRFNGVINKNVNTRLENYINNYAVPDDSSFIKFFETRNSLSEILPNKRLILRILNMSNNKRKIVIDLLETGLKNTLLDYALLENMHLNKRLNYGLEDFK